MADAALRAALLWSALQVLNRERFEALVQVFGTLEEAGKHVDEQLLRSFGCREQTVRAVMERLAKYDAEKEVELLQSSAAKIITLGDASYPDRLRDIPDSPVFLYARGHLSITQHPCVGLVGTRRMSVYGKRVTQEFTRTLVHSNLVTVSGLAYGVDACVAEETLAAKGRTIAVLGHGLLVHSRSTAEALAGNIIASGGLILSEFPLLYPADMFTFPLRNRIVAGLSLGTVVFEAPEGSGALITAKLAFDYGREVFAVPGQIHDENYVGCHALIRQDRAKLVPQCILKNEFQNFHRDASG